MEVKLNSALVIEYCLAFIIGTISIWLLNGPFVVIGIWAAIIAFIILVLGLKGHYADALLRLIFPVVFGVLMFALYHWSHDITYTKQILQQPFDDFDQYTGEQYYAVISTLFAIITALILVKGIESFDKLNAIIVEEGNQVRSIVEFLYYFEENETNGYLNRAITHNIRNDMLKYCNESSKNPDVISSVDSNHILREATKHVGKIECEDENDKMALAEVMSGLNKLFSIRSQRVAFSRAKIPIYMIFTLGFMSLAIILPFFIGNPKEHPFNAWIISILTTFCIFILMLLRDINSPFEGFWRVDTTAFDLTRQDIEKRQEEDLIYNKKTENRIKSKHFKIESHWQVLKNK